MDGPNKTVHPACMRPNRAQAINVLGKTSSWSQALLWDSAAREPRNALPWMASWKSQAEVPMLITANSNPHGIVIYMDSSVTRDWSGQGFKVKQGKGLYMKTVVPTVATSSLTMEAESHTCNTVASLPKWCTNYICHHSHRLNEPAAKRVEWAALTGTQSCTILHCTGFCGFTPWNCMAEVLRGLRNFLSMDSPEHHSTDRLKQRGVEKGSWHSTLQVRNDLCSIRQTLELFWRQP